MERASAGQGVLLQAVLVRSFFSTCAFVLLSAGYFYFMGKELSPRKLAIVVSSGIAAALMASVWQWHGKTLWSWARTLLTIILLTFVILRLGVAVFAVQGSALSLGERREEVRGIGNVR
jgi:hypothetical protein